MKKLLLLVNLLFIVTISFSQSFYKVGDKLMTKEKFYSDLEIIKQENAPKYTNFVIIEEITRNDSIIKNIQIGIYKNETRASKDYFLLLNKPFPDFKFQDLNNNWYAKSRFLGKQTVVFFIHPKFLPTNKTIKLLNALNKNDKYHVVAFLTDDSVKKSSYNKIEFPILKDSHIWLKLNFFGHQTPQYMLLDENGNLSYFFPKFPNTKDTTTPIKEETREIFNLLAH
ncbi:TlpA family protein disulfide reductase [Xanthomarina sp. F2636L]|uniref:TlpA family protein disulfide reductase n=1 Tax=Xanthomarina sp. F2636L TaxID=2996018 RepID=UPI00225E6C8C|nr:hypothetical protein [Xanthomarina sp. F2636L]MCX7550769.1 hypothetical protein [Xanthomarina sp. F2636L]